MSERLQINIEYNVFEDRLLMRISEKAKHGEGVEYRFWLTRRFVSVFLIATGKIIEDDLAADVQVSPDALVAMKKFQEEAALAKADFSSHYAPDLENFTVIGESPLLVVKMKVRKKLKNRYVFTFMTNENEGINIAVDIDLVHALRKMMFDSVNNAGWNQAVRELDKEDSRKQ